MPRPTPTLGLALSLALSAAGASAQSVRAYHPRLFVSARGQVGAAPITLRARCAQSPSAWDRACRLGAPAPTPPTFPQPRNPPLTVINHALRYLLYGEPSSLDAAREEANRVASFTDRGDESGQLLANATRVLHLAVAYDWLYDALSPNDRATLEAGLQAHVDWNLQHEPRDVFSSEAWAHAAAIGLAGLALATPADTPASPASRYIAYANSRWRGALLPAMGYTRGWWPEGPQWFTAHAGRAALYYALAWSTATGDDLVAWARANAGDPFGGMAQLFAYGLRPDMRFPDFGDGIPEVTAGAQRSRAVLDMLAWATGSPVAQALAQEVTLRVPAGADYGPGEAWHQVVFYEPTRPARPARVDLPLASHLAPQSSDVVVMRGSWSDPEATHVVLSCGDWFTRRQHLDAGGLQVFRGQPLVVSTGTFDGHETRHWLNWYAQRSVHASTLAVVRPGETFPNARMIPSVNDGGQRAMPYHRGRASLLEHRMNLTAGEQLDTGGVTAFETSRFHDYAACDLTRAYNSTAVTAPGAAPKVREVTRQVVLLRPDLVVVFDRVEATDPAFERRFMLHGSARPVPDRDGVFSLSRASARLLGRTLLPAAAPRAVFDDYQVDGTRVPPLVPVDDNRAARLEVSARGAAREYFLHVLQGADTQREALPRNALVEEGDLVGVRVDDPSGARTYTLTFARTGPARGELRVQDTRGAELYRGSLGAGGMFYAAQPDGGVARDASVLDGGVVTPPADDGGCACGVPSRPRAPRASLLAALALCALRSAPRRRRPRR